MWLPAPSDAHSQRQSGRTLIDRLVPKYPAFLIIGLLIVVSGLFLMTTARDVPIVVWANKLFDGDTDQTVFRASQTADQVIGHTLTVWLFLGLSFLKLGIGFAIATIVRNLRATGKRALDAYGTAGVAGIDAGRLKEPWFGRHFTKFLFAGILVMGFFFLLTIWWDTNLVLLKNAEFDGRTSGAAYNTYLMTERVLDPLICGGKFLGEGLLIFGILTGLATIIWNLSLQAQVLPNLTRTALQPDRARDWTESIRPAGSAVLLKLGVLGFLLMALATPLALVRSGFVGWVLGRQFEGSISETAIRVEGLLARSIDPLINMGLGLLLFTIAFLLLNIIRWLREQRQGFGTMVSEVSEGSVSQPAVETSLWPERLVTPLAIFGMFVIGFFFFTMTGVRSFNFDSMLNLQFAGEIDASTYQNAFRLDRMLGPIISATRFIGVASLMLSTGLALVTIVINLRATALLLPAGFTTIIAVSRGEQAEEEDLTVHDPMSLAPWDLFRPVLVGAALVVTAALPMVILFAVSIHRMLEEQYAGLAEPGLMSGLYKSSFLAVNLYGASLQPWMLFGMAFIFFSIGRFFTTIVGFVEARRMVIVEGVEAISEIVALKRAEQTGLHGQNTVAAVKA